MNNFEKFIFYSGVVALILGIIDPLEGSVIIFCGGLLITISAWLSSMEQKYLFLSCTLLLAVGIFFLFYLSSLGGFGGDSGLAWGWSLLIIPYPAGWLVMTGLLIRLEVRRYKSKKS